jgi:hypothetical protein
MVAGDAHHHRGLIVVEDRRDRFVGELLRVADEYELSTAHCGDVYTAVAELARGREQCLMVVGRLADLALEKGRFFGLARENGVHCCCLLDQATTAGREEVLAAAREGAHLAGNVEEIRGALDAWLAAGGCGEADTAGGLLDEEDRATEAELRALLGQETDE